MLCTQVCDCRKKNVAQKSILRLLARVVFWWDGFHSPPISLPYVVAWRDHIANPHYFLHHIALWSGPVHDGFGGIILGQKRNRASLSVCWLNVSLTSLVLDFFSFCGAHVTCLVRFCFRLESCVCVFSPDLRREKMYLIFAWKERDPTGYANCTEVFYYSGENSFPLQQKHAASQKLTFESILSVECLLCSFTFGSEACENACS